jgi:hypothetical protein
MPNISRFDEPANHSYKSLENNYGDILFEVVVAAKMSMLVFWVVTYCLQFQGTMKMEAVYSSETSVSTNKSTLRYNSDD